MGTAFITETVRIGECDIVVYSLSGNNRENLGIICRTITQKMLDDIHSTKSPEDDIFVAVPTTNRLNNAIYDEIKAVLPKSVKISGVLRKLSSSVIRELLLDSDGFHELLYEAYKFLGTGEPDSYVDEAIDAFEKAFKELGHVFRLCKLPLWMQPVIKRTMEKSPEFRKEISAVRIIGRNIIIIDNTIREGDSIKEAYKLLAENFEPKNIHCITSRF